MGVSELWTLKSEVSSPKSELLKFEEIWSSLYCLKFKDRSSKSEGRGLSEVYPKSKIRTLSLKFKVWSLNSDVWSSKSVRSLKSEVWNSKSEVQVWCSKSGRGPKSEVGVWRLKSEVIWLHMYVCVTNKLSESLSPKFDVCTMSDNEGYNPTSEVCSKSTIRSLKTDV